MTTVSNSKKRTPAKGITTETLDAIGKLIHELPEPNRISIPPKEHEARKLLAAIKHEIRSNKDATPKQYTAIERVLGSQTTSVESPLDASGKISHAAAGEFLQKWYDYAAPSPSQATAVKRICAAYNVKAPEVYDARLVHMLFSALDSTEYEAVPKAIGRYQILLGHGGSGNNALYHDIQAAAMNEVSW